MTIKMKMKAVLFAAMFATAGLVAQSAQAANPTFDVAYDNSGGFSGTIGHVFTAPTASFTDMFTFSVGTGFDSSTSITSTFTKIGAATKDVTITGFNLVHVDPITNAILNTIHGANNTPAATPGVPHPTDAWEINASGLSAGSYYVEVLGSVVGTFGGSYAGDISVLAASAVPEPETYGMMLGGLGLLGFVARRKAAKKAA